MNETASDIYPSGDVYEPEARYRRAQLVALVAVCVSVLLLVSGAGYAWYQYKRPNQVSAKECALAQQIIDSAQHLPKDRKAVEKWQAETAANRRANMDGYLGLYISVYESWAAERALGEGTAPTPARFKTLVKEANGHCEDAGRKLVFPALTR